MCSLQARSKKIYKQSQDYNDKPTNYICGGCLRRYMSFPALYLHIKLKHNGVQPPGTVIKRPPFPKISLTTQQETLLKSTKDIDDISELEESLESAQNGLMSFLGEKLLVTSNLMPKTSLEAIEAIILKISQTYTDKWSSEVCEQCKEVILEYKKKNMKERNLDFDDEFKKLNRTNRLRLVAWFLVWLAQIYVKSEFIPDMYKIFTEIWKVINEAKLDIQDLDNKLVWKKVMRNCEGLIHSLLTFKDDLSLLNEFIQKVCQLIGKAFDG